MDEKRENIRKVYLMLHALDANFPELIRGIQSDKNRERVKRVYYDICHENLIMFIANVSNRVILKLIRWYNTKYIPSRNEDIRRMKYKEGEFKYNHSKVDKNVVMKLIDKFYAVQNTFDIDKCISVWGKDSPFYREEVITLKDNGGDNITPFEEDSGYGSENSINHDDAEYEYDEKCGYSNDSNDDDVMVVEEGEEESFIIHRSHHMYNKFQDSGHNLVTFINGLDNKVNKQLFLDWMA